MRLLNTSTITLSEFISEPFPDYAILSHRWDESEVPFQELMAGQHTLTRKPGWSKIKNCCAKAVEEGWEYVWIDCCCIDKSSSAKLSGAINSMFRWYEDAQVCYTYLSDVLSGEENIKALNSAFRRSKWFTTGWTLQELLAPETVGSFCCGKNVLGVTKRHDRDTTKPEDKAYCLLGLLGVNIPLLYGEGERAFIRLQLEIIGISDDESIFAWEREKNMFSTDTDSTGLLARSPLDFKKSGSVQRTRQDIARPPYHMTNKGLRIESFLRPYRSTPTFPSASAPVAFRRLFLMALNCVQAEKTPYLAVYLQKCSDDQFLRYNPYRLPEFDMAHNEMEKIGLDRRIIYIRQPINKSRLHPKFNYDFSVKTRPLLELGFSVTAQDVDMTDPSAGKFGEFQVKWVEDGINGLKINLTGADKYRSAALIFADKGVDAFAVTVHENLYDAWINLLLPKEEAFLENVVVPAIAAAGESRRFDRISKLLESGKSVSIALIKDSKSGGSIFGPYRHRQCSVEITLDLKEHLRWPEIIPIEVEAVSSVGR